MLGGADEEELGGGVDVGVLLEVGEAGALVVDDADADVPDVAAELPDVPDVAPLVPEVPPVAAELPVLAPADSVDAADDPNGKRACRRTNDGPVSGVWRRSLCGAVKKMRKHVAATSRKRAREGESDGDHSMGRTVVVCWLLDVYFYGEGEKDESQTRGNFSGKKSVGVVGGVVEDVVHDEDE